ncbi:acyl-CoA N-acyltransferase [Mollisia scopiformis]|uniref:Acyl-CoA N-acyltransferase n=1 Tax=Mollisia scopiformis TaxID=149040 RepID=A0A132B2X6_MOLSC|nr:acyl-CoA N-acyltransferase [Mollisia scopiformis]KUJ06742.1 acyl-CoA N-acyltransferase [Mollisia scopiformis]
MPDQYAKTPSGQPYIALATTSTTPVFLTTFYLHDIPTLPPLLSMPSLAHQLIAIPQPYTLSDAEWWVNLQMSGKSNLPLQVLRAGDPETGTLIGAISLMPKDSEALQAVKHKLRLAEVRMATEENECELGYYLHPDWQGKRIMSAAVKALLRWGKEELGVENVVIKILEENSKSRAVVERLGSMFARCEQEDSWVDWPETKGGGRRKLLVWRWTGEHA